VRAYIPARLRGKTLLFVVLFAAAVAALSPALSSATTGAHPLANPPRYPITRAQAAPYIGHFQLADPHDPQLVTAAYVARFNEFGYLEGSIVVYTYGANGQETSWIGTTYEYHTVGDTTTIDVISPDNQVIFARLELRPTTGGKLTGELIQVLPPGPTQRITLAPLAVPAATASPEAENGAADPRGAGTVEGAATAASAAAGEDAGIFATAVRAATALGRSAE
jgi:hypothetical protein